MLEFCEESQAARPFLYCTLCAAITHHRKQLGYIHDSTAQLSFHPYSVFHLRKQLIILSHPIH
jgi:hypothetical protein